MNAEVRLDVRATLGAARVEPVYEPEDYFVLRTPLLPVWDWMEASCVTGSPTEAVTALREVWAHPVVREAVYVGSPSLHSRLERWDWQLRHNKDWKLATAFYNYVARMATRPTPFGLFAAVSLGRVGGTGRFHLGNAADNLRPHTRLDTGTVSTVAEHLARKPGLRRAMALRCNETGHRVGDNWQYVEWRLEQDSRVYSLSSVELTEPLELLLSAAREEGRTAWQLADLLATTWPEVEFPEALAFIDGLVDSRLLLPSLEPRLTGSECLPALISELDGLEALKPESEALEEGLKRLKALDAAGLGREPAEYRGVMQAFDPISTATRERNFFQVDLYRDVKDLVLPHGVAEDLAEAAEVLLRLGPERGNQLDEFCHRFTDRYGARRVSLLAALDEETGVGLEPQAGGDDTLLRGVLWQSPAAVPRSSSAAQRVLESLMGQNDRVPREIEISLDNLPKLEESERELVPASSNVFATLVADGSRGLEKGDYRILLHGVAGPSAANLAARFCFGMPDLADRLRGSLETEASTQPDAVFAEIVHLAQDRVGNLIRRPLLRQFEIPVLGGSGAPSHQQIALDDLDVEVRGTSVLLWSRRLGRRIIPRLSTAHNFLGNSLGIYRFLCLLQFHGVVRGGFHVDSAFTGLRRTPRVSCGRVILAPARWRINSEEARSLLRAAPEDRAATLEELRAGIGLPRLVSMADGENALALDLKNPLAVDALFRRLAKTGEVELIESFFDSESLCMEGSVGRFAHELILPLRTTMNRGSRSLSRGVARSQELEQRFHSGGAGAKHATVPDRVRHKFPGSEWLYYRLFGTPNRLDRALREVLAPAAEEFRRDGDCNQWFFIRYGDPTWHLRWRFHGEPAALSGKVMPAMATLAAELKRRGWIRDVEIATYSREVERYGGPSGVAACERWFAQESRRVAALLEAIRGGPREWRWQTAAWGMLSDLSDLGCSADVLRDLFECTAATFRAEFRMDGSRSASLGTKFRSSSSAVMRACAGLPPETMDSALATAIGAIVDADRSQRVAIGKELRALESRGELWGTFEALLPSLVHMTCNRWFSDRPRANEMVLYELLRRGLVAYQWRAGRTL